MAEIKAIEVVAGGVTLKLEVDEARDLLAKLKGLLEPAPVVTVPYYYWELQPTWTPTYGQGTGDPLPQPWSTVVSDGSSSSGPHTTGHS